MDKQQAQTIITATFETSFDKDRFIGFSKNLLNQIKDAPFTYRGNFIPDAYKPYIASLKRIGKYTDGAHQMDILIVQLKRETSLERARTMQRNFIAWYLNGSRGGEMKDAALVAFVAPNEEDWRFSLVKMDYRFEPGKDGKVKVKEEFTPAKRWSFLVGRNEASHTAQSRLVNILADDEHAPTMEEIEKAFDIETVTKEFFLKYRELFLRTKEELDRVVKRDPKIKSDFEAKGVDTVNFAKKLLGQIVFLYFLQKKGWFGVGRDDDWGTGSKHFLRELFEKKHVDYNNFYNDILEPLFYEALRTGEDRKHEDYYYSRFDCKIPFLNGGLFDPIGNYDWVHTDIIIHDKLFSNSEKTKEGDTGTGILDVFDRYNFTVKEDEPLEKEVAIDPELLGKSYEKFNAIRPDNYAEFQKALKSGKTGVENKFNKKFGVYYTPREIVHYMCQQSLINYLNTELNKGTTSYQKISDIQTDAFGHEAKVGQLDLTVEHKSNTQITKDDIETLIKYGEQFGENEAIVETKGRETKTYSYKLPESIRKNAKLIDEKLANIKVCDPAIGSGAFPVGMMHEIVKTRNVLTPFLSLRGAQATKQSQFDDNRTPYYFKRRCIEHSLYGVDIDPGAVEIAKLRLWLSLVVDEDDIKNIKPLPNLDYKVVCGNSLLGVEKDLFNAHLFSELEKLKPLFFNETNPTKKQEYKKQIDKLISEITNGHTEFDFEVYFSEVFHSKGGFDVVISNPPYGAKLSEDHKKYLKRRYIHIIERIRNSFLYFLGLAYDLTNNKSIFSYIIPNEFLFQIYMTKARTFFLKNTQFVYAFNLGEDIFDAIVPSCIVSIKKEKSDAYLIPIADFRNIDLEKLEYRLQEGKFEKLCNNTVLETVNSIFSFNLKNTKLLNRLLKNFQPFEEFCDFVSNGICTSCDEVYIVNKKFSEGNEFEKLFVKHCIRGGQFTRYFCPSDTGDRILYITKDFESLKGEHILKYLNEYRKFLVNKSVEKKKGNRPWHILFRGRDEKLFQIPKIMFRQTGDSIIACIDETVNYYPINSVNIAILKNVFIDRRNFLLGVLNAKLTTFIYREISQEGGRVLAEVKPQRIRALPIAFPEIEKQKPIEKLVERILAITKDEDYLQNPQKQAHVKALEREIDQMVYQLYGLTTEEIATVEENVRK